MAPAIRGGEARLSELRWIAAAAAILVGQAVIDLSLPSANTFGALVVAPFLASSGARPRWVAVLGGIAAVIAFGLGFTDSSSGHATLVLMTVIVIGAVVATRARSMRIRRERRLVDLSTVAEAAHPELAPQVDDGEGHGHFDAAHVDAVEEMADRGGVPPVGASQRDGGTERADNAESDEGGDAEHVHPSSWVQPDHSQASRHYGSRRRTARSSSTSNLDPESMGTRHIESTNARRAGTVRSSDNAPFVCLSLAVAGGWLAIRDDTVFDNFVAPPSER